MLKKIFWCAWMFTFSSLAAFGQLDKEKWIDSVFNTLKLNEKIGQLFITRISSHSAPDVLRVLERKIESEHLGGVLFTSGSVSKQASITNRLQSRPGIQLLVSQDAASGLGYLLDSAMKFPDPLAQGAIANDSIIYWIGREVGRQMNQMGIHMSLSPNANIIGSATTNENMLYGDNVRSVTRRSLLHMKGLRAEGILSCAKFFPLKRLHVIDQKGKTLMKLSYDSLESYPFQFLFDHGLNAVIPDVTDLHPFFERKRSDLRKKISDKTLREFETGNLLHTPLHFNGIVIIDIQLMKNASDKFDPGEAEFFAFQSGADMIISDEQLDPALRKIKKLLRKQKQYVSQLDARVKKILALKYDAGLYKRKIFEPDLLEGRLNTINGQLLRLHSLKKSITIIKNESNILPIQTLEDKNFTCIVAGDTSNGKILYRGIKKYVRSNSLVITEVPEQINLSDQQVIIVSLFPTTTEKVLENVLQVVKNLQPNQQVIIADFGCKNFQPYAGLFKTIIASYSDDDEIVKLVPQIIFGGLPAAGVLPAKYGDIESGASFKTRGLNRLTYSSLPEEAGIDGSTLQKINRIAAEAISSGATPGCHVLVAKEGKVVFDHSFGHLSYDKQFPVTEETIYDLASLTKVSATLQAVMFMQERGMVDINKKISVYLPELKNTNKKDITLVDMLTHQSGLAPFLPLWPLTVDGSAYLPMYYHTQQTAGYPLQISPTLFGSNALTDSVFSWIYTSKMMEKPPRTPYSFRYSDLGFMMFKNLAEAMLNQPLEDFLNQNLYEPLGAYSLGYTPLKRFPKQMIAPTEMDTLFRKTMVVGTVHDERAAMLGGLGGHAGLFGTAKDLSKLGQMLLQEGSYGGLRYFKPETVKFFTAKYFQSSRRGLGWDKPVQGEWNSPTSIFASPDTFGHTGFTGTCLWVDPEFNLVYIFVSNRVFPDRNDKLIKANIRSRIQDVIYEAIFNYCKSTESSDYRYSEQ